METCAAVSIDIALLVSPSKHLVQRIDGLWQWHRIANQLLCAVACFGTDAAVGLKHELVLGLLAAVIAVEYDCSETCAILEILFELFSVKATARLITVWPCELQYIVQLMHVGPVAIATAT